MRDVKFKGLSMNSQWFTGNLTILKKPLVGIYSVNIGSYISNSAGMPFAYQVRHETVGEFTGLKDLYGKEIFHKDLIVNLSRNGKSPHVVEWSNKFGGWVGSYRGLEYLIAQELNEIELVGNIFENKDLI